MNNRNQNPLKDNEYVLSSKADRKTNIKITAEYEKLKREENS